MRIAAGIVVAVFLLGVTAWFEIDSWRAIQGPPAPSGGYVAMAIGTVYALVVVALLGLMIAALRSRN